MQDVPKNMLDPNSSLEPTDTDSSRARNEEGNPKNESEDARLHQTREHENGSPEILPRTGKLVAPPRRDKGRLHLGHGILSRNASEALVKAGEDRSAVRRLVKDLRIQFRPRGPLETLLFDRLVSAVLRCALAARAESQVFAAGILPASFNERARRNRAMILATGNPKATDQGENLLDSLAVLQRYDAYNWNEFRRALEMLSFVRKAGRAGDPQTHDVPSQHRPKSAGPGEPER